MATTIVYRLAPELNCDMDMCPFYKGAGKPDKNGVIRSVKCGLHQSFGLSAKQLTVKACPREEVLRAGLDYVNDQMNKARTDNTIDVTAAKELMDRLYTEVMNDEERAACDRALQERIEANRK